MAIVQDTDVLTTAAAPKRKLNMSQREAAWGFTFLSPWLIGLGLFTLVPMVVSFILSFTNYYLGPTPRSLTFVGLDNYAFMATNGDVQHSVVVTLKFAVLSVPATIFAALGIALLVNQKLLAGKRVFRTLFFMPVQIPLVASVIIWMDFLNGRTGWLKYLLEGIAHGLGQIPFLGFWLVLGLFLAALLCGLVAVTTMGVWDSLRNLLEVFAFGIVVGLLTRAVFALVPDQLLALSLSLAILVCGLVALRRMIGEWSFLWVWFAVSLLGAAALLGVTGAAWNANSVLSTAQSPNWLSDSTWSLPGLVLIGVWGVGNMMLIFLAGLQSVPTELYEAARVDGAGAWKQFRHVTMPMISPVFFYNLLLNIIGTAQYFTQVYVLFGANGGNDKMLYVYNLNLYNTSWPQGEMARGCAMAWAMFVVVLVISVVMFRTSARWVFYAGEQR